jgi:metallo-beta-lactamase superfamily protein
MVAELPSTLLVRSWWVCHGPSAISLTAPTYPAGQRLATACLEIEESITVAEVRGSRCTLTRRVLQGKEPRHTRRSVADCPGRLLPWTRGSHRDQRLLRAFGGIVGIDRRRLGRRRAAIERAAETPFGADHAAGAILLTHCHPDHSGSALQLARTWGCAVHMHSNDCGIGQRSRQAHDRRRDSRRIENVCRQSLI